MEIEKPNKVVSEEDSSEDEIEDFLAQKCEFNFPKELHSLKVSDILIGTLGLGSTIVKSQALANSLKSNKIEVIYEGGKNIFAEAYYSNYNSMLLIAVVRNLGTHMIHNFGDQLMKTVSCEKTNVVIIHSDYLPFVDVSQKEKIRILGNQTLLGENSNVKSLEENIGIHAIAADCFQASLTKSILPVIVFKLQEETEFSTQECGSVCQILNIIYKDLFTPKLDFKEAIKEIRSKISNGLYI